MTARHFQGRKMSKIVIILRSKLLQWQIYVRYTVSLYTVQFFLKKDQTLLLPAEKREGSRSINFVKAFSSPVSPPPPPRVPVNDPEGRSDGMRMRMRMRRRRRRRRRNSLQCSSRCFLPSSWVVFVLAVCMVTATLISGLGSASQLL